MPRIAFSSVDIFGNVFDTNQIQARGVNEFSLVIDLLEYLIHIVSFE